MSVEKLKEYIREIALKYKVPKDRILVAINSKLIEFYLLSEDETGVEYLTAKPIIYK